MKCLAVQQPWAWAICAGFKRVENRSWKTPYRGLVAIVASSKRAGANQAVKEFTGGKLPADLLTFSAIIGTAVLTDVVPLSAAVEDDPHASGPSCWLLTEPKLFETPIPTSGKLRLYNSTPAEAAQIEQARSRPVASPADPVVAAFARSLESAPFDRCLDQADCYWAEGRWPDLERATGKLFALDPTQPEPYFFRANLAYQAGRYQDAIADCNRAIEIDPTWGLAVFARGDVYEKLGDATAAAADHARGIELDPSLADDDTSAKADA